MKTTYVPLSGNANAVLLEPAEPSPNRRIVAINTHPDHNNNFDYFIGRELAARGYRALLHELLRPRGHLRGVPAADRRGGALRSRSLPGVEKVVFATHSGGGPVLTFYQEIAEKGPAACQEPARLYPCRGEGLHGSAQGRRPAAARHQHRRAAPDDLARSRGRERPAAQARAVAGPLRRRRTATTRQTNTATYTPAVRQALSGRASTRAANGSSPMPRHGSGRSKPASGPYQDDEPFVVAGMAENSVGARLTRRRELPVPDPRAAPAPQGRRHRADRDRPLDAQAGGHQPEVRDTLRETTQNITVRHYLSFLALRTTPDFALTEDAMKGIDWRSSANSAPGNVENITVPTLVMAGTCAIHLVPLEIVYDHSAAGQGVRRGRGRQPRSSSRAGPNSVTPGSARSTTSTRG